MTESPHIYYYAGFKYRLSRPFTFMVGIYGFEGGNEWLQITSDGWLEVRPGYAWDGASGPTKDTSSVMRAALVHDCLYQLIRLGVLPESSRPTADYLLRDIMDEDSPKGSGPIGKLKESWNDVRGWFWWRSVRQFGGASILPKSERQELRAP